MYMFFMLCLNMDQVALMPKRCTIEELKSLKHVGIGTVVHMWDVMHIKLVFYHAVGENWDLNQSEALNLVVWRIKLMQPTTQSPRRQSLSWPQFNIQENRCMKCH